MRKMRYSEKPNSLIKSGTGNIRTISKANISYIQRQSARPIKLSAWAKFDEVNFNGISILTSLGDDLINKTMGACSISLFSIAQGNSWDETLIGTKHVTVNGSKAVIDFNASELPFLRGDITFKIAVTAHRLNKAYYHTGYFNHIGSLQFMTKNKNKISFLEITKLDE